MPPGHVFGMKSQWVSCPISLTGGRNLQVYVRPGSNQHTRRGQYSRCSLTEVEAGRGCEKLHVLQASRDHSARRVYTKSGLGYGKY